LTLKKILLSIAGYDPTSGAGVSLDLKVFQHLGFQGIAALTSITSQNTQGVRRVHCLPSDLLWDQYQALDEDVSFSGIKVGMVGCGKNIEIIKRILTDNPKIPKVVDPVFKSSSGAWLLEKDSIPGYVSDIKGKASLLTPNLEEASLISRIKIKNTEDMKKAAQSIFSFSNIPCFIKGGHFPKQVVNLLYDGNKFYFFKEEKIRKNVHGTGCFLSSSVLVYMVKGNSLEKACLLATQLTDKAIKSAIKIGQGQNIISF
jgi:hydroxymethylpyrimidine kinase/phosphomethylpyrimidine kinase